MGIFNGIIDDREALIEMRTSHTSSTASKRQRREEEERERRRESHNARLANDYAQSLLEWSSSVHNHNTNVQRFMESVAEHIGMSSSVIPPLPPPLPRPPTYEVSTSPNQSAENAQTIGSVIGVQNPDETISRIALGLFGVYVNASGSVDGNYSPPVDDIAPY